MEETMNCPKCANNLFVHEKIYVPELDKGTGNVGTHVMGVKCTKCETVFSQSFDKKGKRYLKEGNPFR